MDRVDYYRKMSVAERLMPIIHEGRVAAFMTYYICNDPTIFINRTDQWQFTPDDPTGHICYIDHLITDKDKDNPYHSLLVWHNFKEFIKRKYPAVDIIVWKRYNFKKGESHVYTENLRR